MPHIKELICHGFKSFARETHIPFKNSLNCIVGPNGSGKSCKYDTLVTLSNGKQVMLGKLVEDHLKNSESIQKLEDGIYCNLDKTNPIEIISLNKDTMKAEKKLVSKFIKREGEIIYKIKTRTGKEVEATGCHPVMVFNDGKVESTLIKDLKAGSLIATPRQIEIQGENNFDKDIARLIGYIIGDGYIAKDRIEFVNKDIEVLEDFKKIIKEKFGVEMKERFEKNITRIYIRDKQFVSYIRNLFIPNYENSITSSVKKIPEIFLSSNKDILANVLAGIYDTDGGVRKDIAVIEVCSKNRELALQIQSLLLRFGIISKIKKRICCASNTIEKIKREYYYIYAYGYENFKKFLENIDLKVGYKKEAIKHFTNNLISVNPNLDILPQEVNFFIRDAVISLGIKVKNLRKEYPSLAAYMENRCAPTRIGISKFMNLFETKLASLSQRYSDISLNQVELVNCMDELHISGWSTSKQIGVSKSVIRSCWAKEKYQANRANLQKFHDFIKTTLMLRLLKAKESINLLKIITSSNIYWDQIIAIEQMPKEDYVYDLTIEENHNFIANNIFVHNSNVTDAICFVLGRRGSKSMRAKKLGNLIFAGTDKYKPAQEASVEIVFDNTDKGFSLNEEEIRVKRILRKNGQGVYKINDEVRTLQEVLELLGQAGIDPNGFNIVLQGEIDSFVKMTPEERREVIEEVAGISIYEIRKKHSLQELEKTEGKLKEANAILKERHIYLRNLEEERKQALHFKKLQEDVKNYKASISYKLASEKQDKIEDINDKITREQEAILKLNSLIEKTNQEVTVLNEKINNITQNIQKSSGLEQEKLNSEISDLRADLAGLTIKQQSYQNQIDDMVKRREEIKIMIENGEREIIEMSKSKGKSVKKELEIKKQQLDEIEEQKRKLYILKSNIQSMSSRVDEKQRQLQKLKTEYDFTFNKLQQNESEVIIKENLDSHKEKIAVLRNNLEKARVDLEIEHKERINSEKTIAILEKGIEDQSKIQTQVSSLDTCPLCKTKITKEHVDHVVGNAENEKDKSKKDIENLNQKINSIKEKTERIQTFIKKTEDELRTRSQDVLRLELINEKKENLRKLSEEIKFTEREYQELVKKKEKNEEDISSVKTSEANYDTLRLEVQELQRHDEANVGMEVTLKQRDIERNKNILKQIIRELEEANTLLKEITETIENKQNSLDEKQDQDTGLKARFKKTIEEKNAHQEKIHFYERDLLHKQNEKHLGEERINNLKIERAQFAAQKEAIEQEARDLKDAKILRMSVEELRAKLEETQRIISNLGTVNMKSLEVYENIKVEYEKVQEKVDIIIKEKEEILLVIEEIDKKKKKSFMQALEQLNALFCRNFSQLSDKGIATLEPVDKENLFESGVEMLIKVGKGKYFDTNSLSGGEKSLISLSLIFAIQEYKPYCFYIFDEIDAALDRRNSERLAALLKRYMNQGQYIIITHNDSLITESPVIYGVSMQDKISKVVSLEI